MIPPGITIEGVPLEHHLTDQKRKRFFESIEREVKEDKDIIYHSSKTKCRQRHNTRPGKVRHISKEEYSGMETITKSAGEMIFSMLQNQQWWTIKKICNANKQYGKRAYAQAMARLIERFPSLVLKQKVDGLTYEYSLFGKEEFLTIDLIKLYRKEFSMEQFASRYKSLPDKIKKPDLQNQIEFLTERIKAVEEFSLILERHLAKAQLDINKLQTIKPESESIEVARDSGININIHLIDPRNLK